MNQPDLANEKRQLVSQNARLIRTVLAQEQILRELVQISPYAAWIDSIMVCHYCGVSMHSPHTADCVWMRANAMVSPPPAETKAEGKR
jgi:hypothetical protein